MLWGTSALCTAYCTLLQVTGNSPDVKIEGAAEMLVNQQQVGVQPHAVGGREGGRDAHPLLLQVFLPTNNALSEVGHVHLFLEQLGQGIQHIASRVPGALPSAYSVCCEQSNPDNNHPYVEYGRTRPAWSDFRFSLA